MQPLSIFIAPRDGRYKSISTVQWLDIPGLAILTGRNGSGKTQFLEVLAYHFSGAIPPEGPLPVDVKIVGATYEAHDIGYITAEGRFSGRSEASLASITNVRQNLVSMGLNVHQYRGDITSTIRAKRNHFRFVRNERPESAKSTDPLDDFYYAIDDLDVTDGLIHLFVAHRYKLLQALERGTPDHDMAGKPIGPAPWDVVNESLKVAGFPYEVISPIGTDLLAVYRLRLRDRETSNEIAAFDLPSGEKVLLQLVLWLFSASKEGVFPKLLLLDEPDAHLHPSMTTQFLDVISEVLVGRYGVRVILTTHSPSTVALAPDGSLFQIERGRATISEASSRADIISILTAGLVTVSRTTKFCFVEDEADVEFYSTVRDILSDSGPSKDPMALALTPSIAFLPASIGSGTQKIAGGRSVVGKWVEKLNADPLDRMFFGIVDRDYANHGSARIHVLGRHSFENYLLDPIVVFSLLLEDGIAPPVSGLAISQGDEHLLRLRDQSDLQAIANAVCAAMKMIDVNLSVATSKMVVFTRGPAVVVPEWVIDHRGHDLLPIAQRAFGRTITPPRLLKALRRCRLIPQELAAILTYIQAA
ncbi:AAA family ATPase [Mesorhizobium comanense]|uniref:AAA family ATPase n=1 Tax=Mesorhizobium comanense TaxID=2502215 RepID=UPI0010F950CE|nr:ATP-binding protein [Mesorhizobium comanense]